MKTLSPCCSKTLAACLALLLLLGGCSGTATRDGKTVEPVRLPRSYDNALVLMQSGDYAAAIPVLQAFIEEQPQLAGPYINLGIAYRRTGQPDAALTALTKAAELNPGNTITYQQLGMTYREQGNFEAALEAYTNALKLDSGYALAHRNIGILYDLYLQQPALALDHYKRYLELVGEPDQT
ncbi:MAG: tetratricopeptide repeat protein, partial [Thiogranum sp.]